MSGADIVSLTTALGAVVGLLVKSYADGQRMGKLSLMVETMWYSLFLDRVAQRSRNPGLPLIGKAGQKGWGQRAGQTPYIDLDQAHRGLVPEEVRKRLRLMVLRQPSTYMSERLVIVAEVVRDIGWEELDRLAAEKSMRYWDIMSAITWWVRHYAEQKVSGNLEEEK